MTPRHLLFLHKDFGKSWRDGFGFNILISKIRPDLINMETVGEMASNKERLHYAFDRAEKYLNIPRLNVEGKNQGCGGGSDFYAAFTASASAFVVLTLAAIPAIKLGMWRR